MLLSGSGGSGEVSALGHVGRLGSWLGLDGEVGRKGPQLQLGRLALDGDSDRDAPFDVNFE